MCIPIKSFFTGQPSVEERSQARRSAGGGEKEGRKEWMLRRILEAANRFLRAYKARLSENQAGQSYSCRILHLLNPI